MRPGWRAGRDGVLAGLGAHGGTFWPLAEVHKRRSGAIGWGSNAPWFPERVIGTGGLGTRGTVCGFQAEGGTPNRRLRCSSDCRWA